MADGWFVTRDKQRWGPYPFEQLTQMAVARQILSTDMLLPPGTQRWVPASSFPHFFTPGSPPPPQFVAAPAQPAPAYYPQQAAGPFYPSAVSSDQWQMQKNGQQYGPFNSQQLNQMVMSGQLLPTDMLWKQGLASWVPAGSIPNLFPQMPPTLMAPPYYLPPMHSPPGAVGETLGTIAPLIPLVGTMLIYFWVGSMNLLQNPGSSLTMIVVLTVVSTAVLIGVEASQIGVGGPNDPRVRKGRRVSGPIGSALLALVFWIVGFPAYMYERSHFGLKTLLPAAIIVALLFLATACWMEHAIETRIEEIRRHFR